MTIPPNQDNPALISRRKLLTTTGRVAAAAALAGVAIPRVYAAEDNTIRLALVGCGGRGGGAILNALNADGGPTKLVAMADVFTDRLDSCLASLKEDGKINRHLDVPKDRQFIGFDAYKHAMDALRPGDVVILTTPPAFRWVHFTYAIEKGLNVFMEKPVAVDGPTARRMFKLAEDASKKNLKVGVGLMCRHCLARNELHKRIRDGAIGEIVLLRAYRMHGPLAFCFTGPKPDGISELLYQIQRFHAFLWASGGSYSDFLIHNLDECCWMKDSFPVEAQASGGRHYRGKDIDQNFDSYSVEYTFGDGTKLRLEGRNMEGCFDEFASFAHGTKGSAIISTASHHPAKSRIFKGQKFDKNKVVWHYGPHEPNPYDLEWNDLLHAIRSNSTYNEVPRGTEASLVAAMGRMAAHTGQVITRDLILNHGQEFAPDVDKLTMDSPAPLRLGHDGKYLVPEPGINKDREY